MPNLGQRITLVAHGQSTDIDWSSARAHTERVAFLDSVASLKFVLGTVVSEIGPDIERVIVDRAGSTDEFLDLLATMPAEFNGDAILVRRDGGGFLSALGRGGNRVLYALSPYDIRFYLETYEMITGPPALRLSA